MPEGMQQTKPEPSVESSSAQSDSRLRVERYEDSGSGIELDGIPELSELKLVTADEVLAELESAHRPTAEAVKKGKRQNRGKNWQLKEVPAAYRAWKQELLDLTEGDPRREDLQARIDRAEAMLNAEVAKRNQKAVEARKFEAIRQKTAAHKEKALIKQYRDQGPKGIDRAESQMSAYEESIRALRAKLDAGETVENAESKIAELEAHVLRVKNEIEKRRNALELGSDWAVEHEAKIGVLDGRVAMAEEDLASAKEATATAMRHLTDHYGDVVFELEPPRGPAPEIQQIDMKPTSVDDGPWKKRAKDAATVGAATAGNMGVMGFGFFKDLWDNWRAHVNKPGAMFGGWNWRNFFWRGSGKKK